jgi:hypothetical protein
LADNADGKVFNLSANNIFGRFEQFCERLNKVNIDKIKKKGIEI